MSTYTYYVNGKFVPAEEAGIPFNDTGFVRGYGVFDFLRTYGRTPFRLTDHLQRLQRSAAAIDLTMPWSLEELERIVYATMEHNPDAMDVSIRLVVTGGHSPGFLMPGSEPSLIVLIAPINANPPQHFTQGATLISVDHERFMPSVKSLNYITAIMALKQAKKAGAVEALYRTRDGLLTECTTSNFFIFKDGRLITSDWGVLDGVTRKVTLEIAEDLYEIEYRPIPYAELAEADEAFITSTTKEIMPIVRVDDVTIGSGMVGPHTQRLMAIWPEAVARDAALVAART
jgi:branched-chain amino acid aminotransferase